MDYVVQTCDTDICFSAILVDKGRTWWYNDTPSNMRAPGYPIFKQTHMVESDTIWNLQTVYVDVLATVDGLN